MGHPVGHTIACGPFLPKALPALRPALDPRSYILWNPPIILLKYSLNTSKDITLENKFLLRGFVYTWFQNMLGVLCQPYTGENRFNSENLFLDKVKNFFYSLCFPQVFTRMSWQLHLKTLEYAFKIFLRVHRLLWWLTVGSIYKVTGF